MSPSSWVKNVEPAVMTLSIPGIGSTIVPPIR